MYRLKSVYSMTFPLFPQRRPLWPYLITGFVLLVLTGSVVGYYFAEQLNPAAIIALPTVQQEILKNVGEEHKPLLTDASEWLGLTVPKNYLLLFLNNTELRPGGGFIGSYAVVNLDKGKPTIVAIDGTEILDNAANRTQLALPPAVLNKYLGVDRWYFRDSNWSPDFSQSSRQSLANYRAENGAKANSIDAVIGVTTHVLEELIKMSGPVTVNGIEFTADNVVEKLEYEVEYGFNQRGLERVARKQVLGKLFQTLLEKLGPDMLREPGKYFSVLDELAAQKHILAFSESEASQKKFMDYGWAGLFAPTTTDYLLWVDANMAALKTDYAIDRSLSYAFNPDSTGNLKATATMTYVHKGKFDWRTTRYRTYTRIYVPKGAVLESVFTVDQNGKKVFINETSTEINLDAQVFGVFFTVTPGETKSLSFVYHLPNTVSRAVAGHNYSLSIPKQLGAKTYGLTLSLDFGKTITAATPAEDQKKWGNSVYSQVGSLNVDQWFNVKF